MTKKKLKKKVVKKPVAKKRPAKRSAKRPAAKRAAKRVAARKPRARKPAASKGSRWVKFVEKHGVVLASARGPVPSVAEAVAGEPIVGSWWAHPKGKAIFAALSDIDDSPDVRCFKLVDGKVTFAHRKTWPALVRLGRDGLIATEQLSSLQQEHMPTGEHRNFVTTFPEWVDDDTAAAADALSTDKARAQLAWIETGN
ncbi:MAG TPA: hypothetical protein VM509_04940 [Planctomycetota bacterium]|nr:hypothetical protein [Planctomycetota bacterium]